MSMRNDTEVVNLVDIKSLRDELARLATQNDMLTDARRMDARDLAHMGNRAMLLIGFERHAGISDELINQAAGVTRAYAGLVKSF